MPWFFWSVFRSISDFQVSGPFNMSKTLRDEGHGVTVATLTWTPQERDLYRHVPVCFTAEALHRYKKVNVEGCWCFCVVSEKLLSVSSSLASRRWDASLWSWPNRGFWQVKDIHVLTQKVHFMKKTNDTKKMNWCIKVKQKWSVGATVSALSWIKHRWRESIKTGFSWEIPPAL